MTTHDLKPNSRSALRRTGGFTLMETALAMMIVGFGVMGMMQLLAAGTKSNESGADLAVAVNLANNIHELMAGMPYRDPAAPNAWGTKSGGVAAYNGVMDFNGDTFQPPLDCRRSTISAYSGWAQQVSVTAVAEDMLTSTRPNDPNTSTARVTVVIVHNGEQVYQTSWIAAAPDP